MHLTRSQFIRYAGKIARVGAKIAILSVLTAFKVVAMLIMAFIASRRQNSAHNGNSRKINPSNGRESIRLLDGSYVNRKVRSVNHGKELLHVITYKRRDYVVVKTGKHWRLAR